VKVIINTPYIKDKFQTQYFVIDSYQQLFDSLGEVEKEINYRIASTEG
jgi:phenylalanine-4-hydroxylase